MHIDRCLFLGSIFRKAYVVECRYVWSVTKYFGVSQRMISPGNVYSLIKKVHFYWQDQIYTK
jgi:hypothetical protein